MTNPTQNQNEAQNQILNNFSSDPTIIFTEMAAAKVKELITEENDTELCLRISIKGGGCSGFQYVFTFSHVNADDWVIEKNSVKLVIDPLSYQYLQKAKIDYRQDVNGEQFVISNPNAKTTCGCGSSFTAKEPPNEN